MDFLVALAKDVATIFFTTLAAGIATRLASHQLKKGKRKTTPRRRKHRGGSAR